MESAAPLRIGFLGAGLIATFHSKSIRAAESTLGFPVERAGVFDPDTARCHAFAAASGHTPMPDEQSVIESCDAVYVCTWTSEHPRLVELSGHPTRVGERGGEWLLAEDRLSRPYCQIDQPRVLARPGAHVHGIARVDDRLFVGHRDVTTRCGECIATPGVGIEDTSPFDREPEVRFGRSDALGMERGDESGSEEPDA